MAYVLYEDRGYTDLRHETPTEGSEQVGIVVHVENMGLGHDALRYTRVPTCANGCMRVCLGVQVHTRMREGRHVKGHL